MILIARLIHRVQFWRRFVERLLCGNLFRILRHSSFYWHPVDPLCYTPGFATTT